MRLTKPALALASVLAFICATALVAQNTLVYFEQGGAKQVVASGGEIEVQSGGTLEIQSGATFTATGIVTSTNILDATISADDIATSAVATAEILDATISADDIATSGVATAEILDGTITTTDIAAAAAIARTQLATDSLALVGGAIGNGDLTTATGIPLTATVADDGLWARVYATNVVTFNSDSADNTTDTSIFHFVVTLPENYVAAGGVTLRIPVALIESGAAATDNGSSIDMSCYEQAAGAVGADIVSSSAATFAATDTWYNKDFALTATGLVAGDQLNCVVTGAVIENNAGAETITMKAGLPLLLADVKG